MGGELGMDLEYRPGFLSVDNFSTLQFNSPYK